MRGDAGGLCGLCSGSFELVIYHQSNVKATLRSMSAGKGIILTDRGVAARSVRPDSSSDFKVVHVLLAAHLQD